LRVRAEIAGSVVSVVEMPGFSGFDQVAAAAAVVRCRPVVRVVGGGLAWALV